MSVVSMRIDEGGPEGRRAKEEEARCADSADPECHAAAIKQAAGQAARSAANWAGGRHGAARLGAWGGYVAGARRSAAAGRAPAGSAWR